MNSFQKCLYICQIWWLPIDLNSAKSPIYEVNVGQVLRIYKIEATENRSRECHLDMKLDCDGWIFKGT